MEVEQRSNLPTQIKAKLSATVVPVHTALPGRRRYRVPILKGNPSLKVYLERKLALIPGVSQVRANPTTGSVLVLYSPDLSAASITDFLTDAAHLGQTADIQPEEIPKPGVFVVPRPPSEKAWHTLESEEVLRQLGSSKIDGLHKPIADGRLKKSGQNTLVPVQARSKMDIFTSQFKTLPVALLSGSAALSLVTGGTSEAVVILAVVFANAYLGYATESLAELTIRLLGKMGPSHVVVIRDGRAIPIPAESIVTGDVVVLVPGMYIPADARVIQAENFTVDESALTGESVPVYKTSAPLEKEITPLAERVNMIYRGTLATGGNALAVVTATGQQTEIGRIQNLVAETKPSETPLQKQMEQLSRQLVSMSGIVGGGVFAVGILRGYGFMEMLKTSVSLAIAAVPEGLPTVATTTLAQTALRMKKRNVLVRNLNAVEGLGSTQIICFDKTGTLTMNRMSVVKVLTAESEFAVRKGERLQFEPESAARKLVEIAVLCNETEIHHRDKSDRPALVGSPTETALVELALQQGWNVDSLRQQSPIKKTEHRTEERSFMVTHHQLGGGETLYALKGNPSEVLALCETYWAHGKPRKMSLRQRRLIQKQNESLGADALRVLGFGYREREASGYTWLGLVGIADLPRDGMRELIERFHQAGIHTAMITGDQGATARAVAQQLNLSGGEKLEILDPPPVDDASLRVFARQAEHAHVFSRVSPAEKLQIVRCLKQRGKVVAMVGDGINDAPALKAADIGIAMGKKGTEVARDVADVVLIDDNLESLIAAIELGRTTYAAIKKAVVYLLATNLSESLTVLGGVATGLGQPLNPLQLLWINLVSDVFPALALALEPPEADVLHQPPRDPDEPILTPNDYRKIGREAALMTVGTLFSYGVGVSRYGQGPRAQTMAFANLTASQLLHTLSSRSEKRTIFNRSGLKSNKFVPISVGVGFGLQALSLGVPRVRTMLGATPLSASDLFVCGGAAGLNFLCNELIRFRDHANKTQGVT